MAGKIDEAGRVIAGLAGNPSLAQKVASDPRIQRLVQQNLAGIAQADPRLAARLMANDPDAALEAYQMVVSAGGSVRPRARQLELPMGESPGTEMIPFGVRGGGVPVGGVSGPGVLEDVGTGLIPAPLRGIPGSGPRRLGTTAGTRRGLSGPGVAIQGPRGLSTEVRLPRLTDESGFDSAAQRWADDFELNDVPAGASPGWRQLAGFHARNAASNPAVRRGAAAAAAAAGGIAAVDLMYPENGERPAAGDMTDTSGTEDLVEESRPAPRVAPVAPEPRAMPVDEPPAMPVDEPPDYSFQARELINKLNAMRRKAGGEVPEAKAMMAEINRLLDMANKQKNSPSYKPAMPTDYHGEAQRLLQDLNARRMEAGGEVADTQKVMAEVRRLQALGDRMRNAG